MTKSLRQQAKDLGIPESTLRSRLKRAKEAPISRGARDRQELVHKDSGPLSLEQVKALHPVEPGWHVAGFDISRKKDWWEYKLTLQAPPKPVRDSIKELFHTFSKGWKPPRGRKSSKSLKDGKDILLELSLADVHFGKLAHKPHAGENYDLKIAEQVYSHAVYDMLALASCFKNRLRSAILPVGNDLLHINGWESMTANGTVIDSTDDRYHKIFEVVTRCVISAVAELLERVDHVQVLYVGGNHDRDSAWHVCQFLKAWFRNDPRVVISDEPKNRKYIKHGKVLLGFTHGDTIRLNSLPTVMATECPEWWGCTQHREWHLGHWHKAKESVFVAGDESGGIRYRVLPSLSATDEWHFRNGFVGCQRAAEAYLWSTSGYLGHFSVGARE